MNALRTLAWSAAAGVTLLPCAAGMAATALFGFFRVTRPCRVLLFHSVSRGRKNHLSWYPAPRFAGLVERLRASGTALMRIRDMPGKTGSAGNDDGGGIALAFDDGLDDVYEHAVPLLEARGFRATFFPIAGPAGSRSSWDIYGPQSRLSADRIRKLARSGHEIGSHTMTHPDLARCPAAMVRAELADSKARLEDLTGSGVTSLSFPFGAWTPRVWETARALGYTRGISYRYRNAPPPGLLRAMAVYPFDTVDDIIAKTRTRPRFSHARALGRIMPHFAKGTALWKFRKVYSV